MIIPEVMHAPTVFKSGTLSWNQEIEYLVSVKSCKFLFEHIAKWWMYNTDLMQYFTGKWYTLEANLLCTKI